MKKGFAAFRYWGGPLAAFVILAWMSACSSPASSLPPSDSPKSNSIKIGVMLPLTGTDAKLGQSLQEGIELAVDFENGQVAGKEIKLVIEDEGDHNSAFALDKAKKLVLSDKVDLIMGPYQANVASAVLPYLASIPIIDVKFTSPLTNEETSNDFSFWTAPRFQDYTYPLGIYAVSKGIQSVSTIGYDSPASTSYTEGFIFGFQNSGGKLIQQQWVPLTSTNFSNAINDLRPADATVCGVLGDDAKSIFLSEHHVLAPLQEIPVILLEPNSLLQTIPAEMEQAAMGTLGIQSYTANLDNPENIKFVAAFQNKYGVTPDAQICAAYSGMRVIIEALKTNLGDTSPSKLKEALLKTQIDLPSGQFKFSQSRTGLQPLRVCSLQRVGGTVQWITLKEFPPAEYYHPLP